MRDGSERKPTAAALRIWAHAITQLAGTRGLGHQLAILAETAHTKHWARAGDRNAT